MRVLLSTGLRISSDAVYAATLGAALLAPLAADAADDKPDRIVSIGGATTEILYALGAEQRIVAVDSTSQYPAQALKEKPNVGYMRALSPEGVLGLNPSLILASEGAGPKETVAVLKAAKVPFVTVPDHFSGPGIVEKIETVAAAVGAPERGACLIKTVRADLDALERVRGRIDKPFRVMFLLSFAGGRPMVAGGATAADGIIRLAGARNAITAFESYKRVSGEAIIAAKPDVVLAMQRPGFHLDADAVFKHPAFALTPAAQQRRLVSMDGLYLLGFGPRTALAARDLATALYPDLSVDKFPSERGGTPNEACR